MNKRNIVIIPAIILLLLVILNFKHTDYTADFKQDYKVYAIPLPKKASFAGEEIPLQLPHIREAYDRELHVNTYWQSQTLLFLKLANKYFPVIEPILKENNIPDDFKYLALAESGLRNITSPAGAKGFWQLMEGTARDYGLEVNSVIDERYHIQKSTQAACKYLNESFEHFKNWTMVAASYNIGRRGLNRQIDRQSENDYYKLVLGPETGRYVYRIAAIKEILEHPIKYGFHYRPEDLYAPSTVKYTAVDTTLKDFTDFNKIHGLNYNTLKYYNPWLRENYLHQTKSKTYRIAVPQIKTQNQ